LRRFCLARKVPAAAKVGFGELRGEELGAQALELCGGESFRPGRAKVGTELVNVFEHFAEEGGPHVFAPGVCGREVRRKARTEKDPF
jgi:hypothetical protein